MKNQLFCFGYGYAAQALVKALPEGDWRICGTTRDAEKRKTMLADGIRAWLFDYDAPILDFHEVVHGTTHILLSVPPDDDGDTVFRNFGSDIAEMGGVKWLGYLSTTGVYGNRDGAWVDESATPAPTSRRGERRLRAERQWMSLFRDYGLPVHVFRLAGIYGPGRNALETVMAGSDRRIDKPGHVFNRIHVDDIVQVLLASIARPNPGAVYNLADDAPSPSHEVIAYACSLLGIEPGPLIPHDQAGLAPITLSFYKDNKRVRNDRIKQELGVTLKHPDFKSGIDACYEALRVSGTLPHAQHHNHNHNHNHNHAPAAGRATEEA